MENRTRFCCDCVSSVLGIQCRVFIAEFSKVDDADSGGGPPRMVSSCCVRVVTQSCGGFGECSPMFFVVLCDDVVRKLCARTTKIVYLIFSWRGQRDRLSVLFTMS